MGFEDRQDGGRQLARRLRALRLDAPLILALPRGGVPVGYEIATAMDAPLDVFVARKIGAPGRPEFGVGAIAEGGAMVLDERVLDALGLTPQDMEPTVQAERKELERRVRDYRGGRPAPEVRGRDVVVVDDGLATGVTARAALQALREREPARLVMAAPVGAPETVERLRGDIDQVVCVETPRAFRAVGQWYRRFDQTSDEEVKDLLERARGG